MDMFMISIAIIDVIGLTYDGNTLDKRGLGGSESAVILMSKNLQKIGFDVTVFNSCIDREALPGTYNGVKFRDLTELDNNNDCSFDIVISSRTVIPFLPQSEWNQFQQYNPQRFDKIRQQTRLKIVWMHDTFLLGDHLLEPLLVHNYIDEIFTLSDFHTSYITTCVHGPKRNFEVLKNKIFHTRNGITKYLKEVNVPNKDPFLYVYNASVTKGMIPLVERMWPIIKNNIPQAKLKVVGGYYRFRENAAPDEQEKKWRELANDIKYNNLDVEFTGIIKQNEIAELLSKASFFLLPGAFPETFGISTLEAIAYNCVPITTRFGALEEVAIDMASYKINYAIEPNGLFPHINGSEQEMKYINAVIEASNNRYLLQQKMYYCNIIEDICTWDTVALQWKQHFYYKLNEFLSREEYQEVSYINSRIRQVFGRKFCNNEDIYIPRKREQSIVVITPMYNAAKYIEKCIESVVTQDYDNWKMIIIDDKSSDESLSIAIKYQSDKISIIKNDVNCGALYNQVSAITSFCLEDDIVMLLDGDDTLVNNNQIFHFYNNLYHKDTEFTYGSCWSMVDNIPLVSQNYPENIKQTGKYKHHLFNWNMPYTHLRTFRAKLINGINDDVFKDENGNWYKAGGDGALFYALIKQADPSKIKVVQDVIYSYNDCNPLNDYKVNGSEQTKNATRILQC